MSAPLAPLKKSIDLERNRVGPLLDSNRDSGGQMRRAGTDLQRSSPKFRQHAR